jgi:ethanolamine utilization protein EutM
MAQAIGMIETKGLVPLVMASDAMMKAANVELMGWKKVGSAYCSVTVAGDVAAVKASVEAGMAAAKEVGEVVQTLVIPRPHQDLGVVLPK